MKCKLCDKDTPQAVYVANMGQCSECFERCDCAGLEKL